MGFLQSLFKPLADAIAPAYNLILPKPVYNAAGVQIGVFQDDFLRPDLLQSACMGVLDYYPWVSEADTGPFSELLTTDSQGNWIPLCTYCNGRGVACLQVTHGGVASNGSHAILTTLPNGSQVPSGQATSPTASAAGAAGIWGPTIPGLGIPVAVGIIGAGALLWAVSGRKR